MNVFGGILRCVGVAIAALALTIGFSAPSALADDRVTMNNTTFDPVSHSAAVDWFPFLGARAYQLRFFYPDGSTCEKVVNETSVVWTEASAPCPLTQDRGRYHVEVAPIGDQLVPAFNSSKSFFVDTPKKKRKSGRAVFTVFLDSPSCDLRLGEVRGEIRRGKKTMTEVFWNPEAALSASGARSLTSCGAFTREAFKVKKKDRLDLYVGGKLCTTFKGNYLLNSDNPQISCRVDRTGSPLKSPSGGADAPGQGSDSSLSDPADGSQSANQTVTVVYTIARGYGSGFNDVMPGTQVEVFDGSGRLLGFGSLGAANFSDACSCAVLQSAFEVPRSTDGLYRVTAGNSNRGFLNFSQSDVVGGVLNVQAFLL